MPSLLRTESARLEIYKAQYNQVKAIDIVWKNCGCAVVHPCGSFWLTPRQILFHFPNFCRLSFLACFFVSLWVLVACRMHYLNILKQPLGKRYRVGRTFLIVWAWKPKKWFIHSYARWSTKGCSPGARSPVRGCCCAFYVLYIYIDICCTLYTLYILHIYIDIFIYIYFYIYNYSRCCWRAGLEWFVYGYRYEVHTTWTIDCFHQQVI